MASPFLKDPKFGGGFVDDDEGVSLSATDPSRDIRFARAGARRDIFFDPTKTTAAVVTCGGLCPGLNDVVQGIAKKLHDYGVPEDNVIGVRYGFKGFYSKKTPPLNLTRSFVDGIHLSGGTVLGASRGGAKMDQIVRKIDLWGVDMVFVVGGNGGHAGAAALVRELEANDVTCSVVGVPKSIDNDILLVDKTFGFDTAVEEAQRALLAAKVEASSAYRGIGVVKLMGRHSGFIAMQASMASGCVDVVLVPEVDFHLRGPGGLFEHLGDVLEDRGHAVVCVAEGAGQGFLSADKVEEFDASGNSVLENVGTWLAAEIKGEFADSDVKYIDPSYLIRSTPATSGDRIYCKLLAHNAVHAAFAGYTGVTVGMLNTHYAYLPIQAVITAPRRVDPLGKSWNSLCASTGQPSFGAAP
jgi:6-phosphofructokinase 1